MKRLDRHHLEVEQLLVQLQDQHNNIGKVSSFVGYANVNYLRNELYARGWNSRLAEDEVTVILFPREEEAHGEDTGTDRQA